MFDFPHSVKQNAVCIDWRILCYLCRKEKGNDCLSTTLGTVKGQPVIPVVLTVPTLALKITHPGHSLCCVVGCSVVPDSLWLPMDCSLPGSSVLGTLQARILEWVVMPSSRESSHPRDQTQVSCIAGDFSLFTIWATKASLSWPLSGREKLSSALSVLLVGQRIQLAWDRLTGEKPTNSMVWMHTRAPGKLSNLPK